MLAEFARMVGGRVLGQIAGAGIKATGDWQKKLVDDAVVACWKGGDRNIESLADRIHQHVIAIVRELEAKASPRLQAAE